MSRMPAWEPFDEKALEGLHATAFTDEQIEALKDALRSAFGDFIKVAYPITRGLDAEEVREKQRLLKPGGR